MFFYRRTLARDLVLGLLVVLVLAFSLVVGFWYVVSVQREYSQLTMKANEIMTSCGQVLIGPLWNLDEDEVGKILSAYGEVEIVSRIAVRDSLHHHLVAAIEHKDKPSFLTLEKTLSYRNQDVGTLEVSFSNQTLDKQARSFLFYALAIFLISICLGLPTIGLLIVYSLHRPIARIKEGLVGIAQGDYGRLLPLGKQEDLNSLIRSVNNLSLEVKLRTDDIKANYARLELARVVQSAILPHPGFSSKNAVVAWEYLPMESIGGDWFHLIDNDHALTVIVGDVTGHGVAASLVTMAVAGAFLALEGGDSSPSELMARIDRTVDGVAGGSPLGMSCLVARLDRVKQELVICNAGHPFPLFLQKGEGATMTLRSLNRAPNPLLGEGQSQSHVFKEWAYPMAVDDRVIFYTDGLTQGVGKDQSPFYKILYRWLKTVTPEMGCQQIKDSILTAYQTHTQGVAADDDVCLVVASLKEHR